MLASAERRIAAGQFTDLTGRKGVWSIISYAPRHAIQHVTLTIPGWPVLPRPIRIAFLADLHLGSHTNDIARLQAMLDDVVVFNPDIGCLGGDYTNNMLFGRGRIPPEVTFSIISQLKPSIGWFSVLGDHDELYGINRASSAFSNAGIRVLIDDRETVSLLGYEIDIIGLKPTSANPNKSMAALLLGRPSIVLAHDPAAFSCLPRGPYLMLSGHTHGGQIQLPWIGPLINMSEASLRWTHGIVIENDQHLYVTSGIGTSGIPVRIGIRPEVALISVNGSE